MSSHRKYLRLFLIFFIVAVPEVFPFSDETLVRLCGKQLLTALKHLCNHQYITPKVAYYVHRPKRHGSIVMECCEKHCTVGYLRSFCGSD